MKYKNILILFIINISIVCNTRAQPGSHEAYYRDGDKALREFLQKKFSSSIKASDLQVCYISATIARFTIGADGNIADIKFSENSDTPPVFRNVLTDLIISTNGKWTPKVINGKAVESKPFILPLIFQMEAGCHGQHINNGTDNALVAFFYGNNGMTKDEPQLDCILLKSLIIFSQN